MKNTHWMSLLLGMTAALVASPAPAQMNPGQSRNAPTEIEQLQKAFRYFQEEGARTRAALETAQAEQARLEQELAALRQAADRVRAEAASTTTEREQELQVQIQAAERQAQRLTQENEGLRQQLAETSARLTDLEVAAATVPGPDAIPPPAPADDEPMDLPPVPAPPATPEAPLEFVWGAEDTDLVLPPPEPAPTEDIPSVTVPETADVEMELEEIMIPAETTGEFEIEDLTETVAAPAPPPEPPIIIEPILPEDEPPALPSIEERLTQGTRALRQGDLTTARRAFDSVLAEQPTQLTALLGLATCEYATDNFDAADELLSVALMRVPNHGEALGLRAIIRWRQGRTEHAQNLLRRALTADSSNAQIFNYQGIIAHGQNDLPAAAEAFRRAITLDPDHIEAHFNLAVISVMLNPPRKEEARSYYEKAVSLGGEKNEALEELIY
ncbi:MAG: tetratricopeptide repeat protein [Candidatus Marinimicrobia bacterium]|nr:tetratricopeptide repeat protein [Candidatus Neomarinimicrobiota bacterium]